MLTGSARVTQEAKDESAALIGRQEIERKQLLLQRKRQALDAQIAALQLDLETEVQESEQLIAQEKLKVEKWEQDRGVMVTSRYGNSGTQKENGRPAATAGKGK